MMDDQKTKLWTEIKHFAPSEFDDPTSPGSGLAGMNVEFVKILDALREKIKFPIHIDSGFRTPEHNAKVGGKVDSAHLNGVAADISCPDSATRDLILKYSFELGIKRRGIGENFIHLDLSYELPQDVTWLYPAGQKG